MRLQAAAELVTRVPQLGSRRLVRPWGWRGANWYNQHHHHTRLALLTPADVHYGRAAQIIARRQAVLAQAYARHLARFVKVAPVHPALPLAVGTNLPKPAPALDTDKEPIH